MPTADAPPTTPRRWTWLLAIAVAILVPVALYYDLPARFPHLLAWIAGSGRWAPAMFIAAYILATILMIPGTVFTVGAGALFGVVTGSVVVSIGSTVGATCAFVIGRHFARAAVARRLAGNPRFAAIDRAVSTDGWKVVGLTRLSPLMPYSLLNYAFGLTSVSLRHFVVASWLGMMPGTVMYVYLGSLVRAGVSDQRTAAEWVLDGVGVAATVVVTVFITRRARAALGGSIDE